MLPKFLKSDEGRRSINTFGSFARIRASTSVGRGAIFAAPVGAFLLIGSLRVFLSSDSGMTLAVRS